MHGHGLCCKECHTHYRPRKRARIFPKCTCMRVVDVSLTLLQRSVIIHGPRQKSLMTYSTIVCVRQWKIGQLQHKSKERATEKYSTPRDLVVLLGHVMPTNMDMSTVMHLSLLASNQHFRFQLKLQVQMNVGWYFGFLSIRSEAWVWDSKGEYPTMVWLRMDTSRLLSITHHIVQGESAKLQRNHVDRMCPAHCTSTEYLMVVQWAGAFNLHQRDCFRVWTGLGCELREHELFGHGQVLRSKSTEGSHVNDVVFKALYEHLHTVLL